jgi:hypothetical protein
MPTACALSGRRGARVQVTGNLKFDAAETPQPSEALVARFGPAARADRPLFVAGSTTAGEEELVLAAFRRVLERVPRAALLLAPRHPSGSTGWRPSLPPSASGAFAVRLSSPGAGGTRKW